MTNTERKAVQLVAEGRVAANRYADVVVGQVTGWTDTYRVVLTPDPDESFCQCKASRLGHRRCSHMIAVEILEAIPVPEAPNEEEQYAH